jgi:hypothetical protein
VAWDGVLNVWWAVSDDLPIIAEAATLDKLVSRVIEALSELKVDAASEASPEVQLGLSLPIRSTPRFVRLKGAG